MVFQEHLRGEIRLTREIRCGCCFFFSWWKQMFFTVLQEAKARAVWVALGFCAGRLSCYQWGESEREKAIPCGWKFRGLKALEQLCEGCVQEYITFLCWLFRKYRLLTQIAQLGGIRKAMVYLPPASKICQVNLSVSTRFSLGGVTGSCAHENRVFAGVCNTPCIAGIIICFIPRDYPAWEKSVRI